MGSSEGWRDKFTTSQHLGSVVSNFRVVPVFWDDQLDSSNRRLPAADADVHVFCRWPSQSWL